MPVCPHRRFHLAKVRASLDIDRTAQFELTELTSLRVAVAATVSNEYSRSCKD